MGFRNLAGAGWIVKGPTAGSVVRFHLATPWGGGPAVALDLATAEIIVDLVRGLAGPHGEAVVVLPGENVSGQDLLRRLGFVEVRRLPRMIRGDPILWHPAVAWGVFSMALG